MKKYLSSLNAFSLESILNKDKIEPYIKRIISSNMNYDVEDLVSNQDYQNITNKFLFFIENKLYSRGLSIIKSILLNKSIDE